MLRRFHTLKLGRQLLDLQQKRVFLQSGSILSCIQVLQVLVELVLFARRVAPVSIRVITILSDLHEVLNCQ